MTQDIKDNAAGLDGLFSRAAEPAPDLPEGLEVTDTFTNANDTLTAITAAMETGERTLAAAEDTFAGADALIRGDLGALEDRFAAFNPKPIAAASLGQAHRAQLPTGERVIVKDFDLCIQRGDRVALVVLVAGGTFAMGTGLSAGIARLTRGSLLQVIQSDYIRTARAKGLHARVVLARHALKNDYGLSANMSCRGGARVMLTAVSDQI
mgnify:CR=1 FL=1